MIKLFAGTAHPILSNEISKLTGLPLSKAEVVRFGNSEVKVTIQEDVRDSVCVIIQPTSNPTDTNIMELLLFCDALKREEARKVIAYVPWFGYAKQDIQHRTGECVSVNVIIHMLESIGFYKVYTVDLHDEATAGVFTIPFKNLSAFSILAKYIRNYFLKNKIDLDRIALVSPDQGAVEKVRNFGVEFYGTTKFSEVVIEKKRDQNIMHKATPLDLYGNVENKIAVIIDDMVVSGSTIIPAVDLCLERGARSVYAAAVHHDFTASAPKRLQESRLKKFFFTNTILLKPENKFEKLEEISIASLIADELKKYL
ncbi:MAG: Ribose-phosphate pyrophosphokinase [Candidatus Roizmanbacteria bacterium GW2011_GWA2_36_23]|uniref:ribose-phosphate diphosphokinase n=1 Tax=Candidatus Roizmanbacteria bacterium GW2011_GWA2_36_23 TaxID=1618480 RepID=A0A0G0E8C8_9BACT|nr:MAG: Ribose-phosphate pyrophosphokinase [Candidatus Roizmanbacteria bacterium GW2011_GWA2_36_23]